MKKENYVKYIVNTTYIKYFNNFQIMLVGKSLFYHVKDIKVSNKATEIKKE